MFKTFDTTALVHKGFIVIDGEAFSNCEYRKVSLERFKESPDGTFQASYGMYPNESYCGTYLVIERMPREATTTVRLRVNVEVPTLWRNQMRYVCPVCTSTSDFDVLGVLPVRLSSQRYIKTGQSRIRQCHGEPIKNARIDGKNTKCTCRNCGYSGVVDQFKCHLWSEVKKEV